MEESAHCYQTCVYFIVQTKPGYQEPKQNQEVEKIIQTRTETKPGTQKYKNQ